MLEYPSISSEIIFGGPYLIWDKLDGWNIRTEWSKKRGFYKFGARHTHLSEPYRDEVIQLIEFQREPLQEVFRKRRWDRSTLFFEFYGAHSLAGIHLPNDPKMVALIDAADPFDQIMDPRDFEGFFNGRVQTAALLGRGNFNREMANQVRNGTFPGMTFEGVVVKGPAQQKDRLPVMFKCKNQDWYEKVRSTFGDRAETEDLL